MAGFENYVEEAKEIELEIERKGIVLGIDWTNDVQVRALAKEALDQSAAEIKLAASSPIDRKLMAKVDLFGLAGIMLKTMEECAGSLWLHHLARRRGREARSHPRRDR